MPGETGNKTEQIQDRELGDVLARGTGMSEMDAGWRPWRGPKVSGDGVLDHNSPPGLWGKPST